jgi:hypothetical protein
MISKPGLASFLFSQGWPDVVLEDERYALFSEDWLFGAPMYHAALAHLEEDVGPYVEGEADCDDYALSAVTWLNHVHRTTTDRPPNVGCAVGRFERPVHMGRGHKLNYIVSRREDQLYIVMFDPQGWVRIPTFEYQDMLLCGNVTLP